MPSFVETDFTGLMEFTNRQVLITRVYAQKMWGMAAATHLLYCLSLVIGTILTLSDFLATRPAFHLAALTFLPVLLSMIRGALRAAGRVGSLAGTPFTNRGPGVDLCAVDGHSSHFYTW